jgi:hypothetical protein
VGQPATPTRCDYYGQDTGGEQGPLANVCRRVRHARFGPPSTPSPLITRCRRAMDVKRATDLYAQDWTLRQIGAEPTAIP